jgi:ketosteroid isomerase-like protein
MFRHRTNRIVMLLSTLAFLTFTGLTLLARDSGKKPALTSQPTSSASTAADSDVLAKAQALNDELDRLQATEDQTKQAEIFADDIVQMNPNHPRIEGKEEVKRMMATLRAKPTRIVSSKTRAIKAWQSGNMLFEYGTTEGRLKTAGGAVVDDPGDFFLAWVADPAASGGYKVQFSMWNTTKPVAQTKELAAQK